MLITDKENNISGKSEKSLDNLCFFYSWRIIIDSYQLYESLCAGADSVLLIARILSAEKLQELAQLSARLGLDAVCEVHNEEDLDKVSGAEFTIIGIQEQ